MLAGFDDKILRKVLRAMHNEGMKTGSNDVRMLESASGDGKMLPNTNP